jgi:hypothetical protein
MRDAIGVAGRDATWSTYRTHQAQQFIILQMQRLLHDVALTG